MITKENIKEVVEALSVNIRILHGNMKLSLLEDHKTIHTVGAKKTQIIVIGEFDNDGEDLIIAKKAMIENISKKLNLNLSVSQINNLYK